jgi:hypothetical protein
MRQFHELQRNQSKVLAATDITPELHQSMQDLEKR